MNIPNIPTDNLYKFTSIFGLVIFIATVYITINEADKHSLLKSNFNAENDHIESLMIRADSTKQLRISLMSDSLLTENYLLQLVLDEEEYLLREVDRLSINYRSNSEHIEWAKNKFNVIKKMFYIFSFLSLVFIVGGFHQWFFKYQRYIDAQVKIEGEKYLKKLKKKSNPKSK